MAKGLTQSRTVMAVVAASLAMVLGRLCFEDLDSIVLGRVDSWASLDGPARAANVLVAPLQLIVTPGLCALYILPAMKFFLRQIRLPRWRVPLAAGATAGCPWFAIWLLVSLFPSPNMDRILDSIVGTGMFIAWPAFWAALIMGLAIASRVPIGGQIPPKLGAPR